MNIGAGYNGRMMLRDAWRGSRRKFLQIATALSGLALAPALLADLAQSFAAKSYDAALEGLAGGRTIAAHPDIKLDAPDIAEDSGKVPIQIHAPLPGVQQISILVEANPAPLISVSRIHAHAEPYVSLRVKMRETSRVTVLVHTADGIFRADREVTVTGGGCA